MRRFGCREAMSPNDGGSTTLYYKGRRGSGIVNTPADGPIRAVCNAIHIKAKQSHKW